MKKYMIAEEINTNGMAPKEVLWEGTQSLAPISKLAPNVGGAAGILNAGIQFLAKKFNKEIITYINSAEQLSLYKNAISDSWRTNIVYVEHPYADKVLVEASQFKDYVLRDMVADLTDYIASQFDVKRLVVGRVVGKHVSAEATVKTIDLNPEAKILRTLDCSYNCVLYNAKATPSCRPNHTWVNLFPDVISAVSHQAESYENQININMDLNVDFGLPEKLKGAFGAKSGYSFYITYERA